MMLTAAAIPRTLDSSRRWQLRTLDQTLLPFQRRELALDGAAACAEAIRTMQVRGAPLIGAVAAFGLAFALRERGGADAALERGEAALLATRPTAVNLRWAVQRVAAAVAGLPAAARADAAWDEAQRIADEDVAINAAIGEHGARLLRDKAAGKPLQLLTHCNAGRLATVAHGTALAPVYALHRSGVAVHVWVDETRPRNQGAALTAWELAQAGVPCTVIADNAGGLLMRERRVDAVIVGCDRVARNGDVANKIGTYLKALAAADNAVPFYVAMPSPTFDASLPSGDAIPIERRDARELTHARGRDDAGRCIEVQLTPDAIDADNPAFDVTPARLVTALITEHGVLDAGDDALRRLPARAGAEQ
ncbi:MAG TPA: S-methyl-5-thioribose-1-phosphate isomerase [Burkholderiaceae bacterium]|nr:S-methyl-5-thioribose-1-phosphate isomerase [Burkholderiaceae bacterium]